MLEEIAKNGPAYIEREFYDRKNIITSKAGISTTVASYDWFVKSHTHDYFEIEIILSGKAEHHINGVKYEISRGDAYFVSPTDWHSITPSEKVTRLTISYTENADISHYLFDIITSNAPAMCFFTEDELNIIEHVAELVFTNTPLSEELRERYLRNLNECILLLTLNKMETVSPSQPKRRSLSKAIQYISTNFKKPITLNELAEVSGLSKTYFSHMFNQIFDINVNEYINSIRLEYAKNQLTMTNDLITVIAEESGFRSYSLFSRLFKERYGISPAAVRK